MNDIFPFPTVRGNTPEEKISELTNYLIQFKETLEFALNNISIENLSPELIDKLNGLGANIDKMTSVREEELAQLSVKELKLTVNDVVNSPSFGEAVNKEVSKATFSVNFDTGHLEYTF